LSLVLEKDFEGLLVNLDLKSTDKIEDLIQKIRQINKDNNQGKAESSSFLLNLRINDKSS
jgi:hypothetical protein